MNVPKVGTKVKVNSKMGLLDVGQTGVVSKVLLSLNTMIGMSSFTFEVKWDNGSQAHVLGWNESIWDCLDIGDEVPATLRSNQPRDCACGIFRGDCTYHKE